VSLTVVFVDTQKKSRLVWSRQIWFGIFQFVWFDQFTDKQTKVNNDFQINLICKFVCGFCGHKKKRKEKIQTGL